MNQAFMGRPAATPVAKVPGVKYILAVGSGKGGVGKSTVAINLAVALQHAGARVGLLDADIYGPNQPLLLGVCQKPELNDHNKMIPVNAHGLQTQSMGYLIDSDAPMVWRGPMVSKALQQLIFETAWDSLDYLILDLPPGTGDVQLTIAQRIPVTGTIIVTTPQRLAVTDAAKGIAMFKKVNISVLGVVENMSAVICSACNHREAVFGTGGGAKLAKEFNVPLLAEIPLNKVICESSDAGVPILLSSPDDQLSQVFMKLASDINDLMPVT